MNPAYSWYNTRPIAKGAYMTKNTPFTVSQLEAIVEKHPTPFHIYDEKAIRENARRLKAAFAWNRGFREFFAAFSRNAAR